MAKTTRTSNKRAADSKKRKEALKNGWRSGFEMDLAAFLRSEGIEFEYEQNKIQYIVPARNAKYTPDFYIKTRTGKTIIVETKGHFVTSDRQKMILVKQQFPDLDIRLVFSRSSTKISKQSNTTYAMWCEKHGFPYADKVVPQEWLDE